MHGMRVPEPAGLTGAEFAAVARALADPRRYGILTEIAAATDPLPCCGLREARNVSAATISHHIKELEAAGLVETTRQGKFAILRFRRDRFDAYLRQLAAGVAGPDPAA